MSKPPSAAEQCRTCGALLYEGPGGAVCPSCSFGIALDLGEARGPQAGGVEGYELLDELGRGAMGVVWLAREKSLNRMVALKLMRTGTDPLLRQRLLREGHAAARLRHPHIVAVHAMGRNQDGAYLAMDYLEGGNLEEQIRHKPMAVREAASLLAKIASALVCAHTSGVLHRDLKPSNILLDAKGEPHLADFGLAAPIEGAGDLTVAGQVAGTPAFLAPEVLQGTEHATIHSDIYGLGAVLYACLTGRAPYIGDGPAAVFAQVSQGDLLSPRLLRPEVPRDLETICLKCMELAPANRYASAQALQDDLERFLRGEAIAARPVGALDKSVRWCRRRPAAAMSIGLALTLVSLLAVGGPIVAFRLDRARRTADSEAANSQAIAGFLAHDVLEQAAPEKDAGHELTLRSVLDRAAAKIDGRFPGDPRVEAALEDTLAKTYNSLGLYARARHHWERVYDLRRQALGPDAPDTVRSLVPLIDCLRSEGKLQEAVDLGVRTVEEAKRVLGPENVDTLTAMASLGNALDYQKKYSLAQPITLQVLAIRQRVLGPEHPDTILAMSNLAFEYEATGQYEKAEAMCQRAFELRRRILGPDNPDTLVSMNNLGAIFLDEGQFARAASWCADVTDRFRRVCGPEHPKTLIATGGLASALRMNGEYAKAEALYRSILQTRERVLGPQHPSALLIKTYLAETLRLEGRLTEAEAVARATWKARTQVLGANHPDTLKSAYEVAMILADENRLAEAEAICRQAIPVTDADLGPTSIQSLEARDELSDILLREGRYADAEGEARAAFDGWSQRTDKSWQLYAAQSRLAAAMIGEHQLPAARQLLSEADKQLQTRRNQIPASDRHVVDEAGDRLKVAMAQ